MKYQKKHNDAGFTIMEVMVAIMIFAIGMLAAMQMQIAAINGNATARRVTEAVAFGSDHIEQVMSWDYNDSRLNPANNNDYTLPDESIITRDGHRADPSGRYDLYWDVTDNSPVPDSRTIDIEVIWQYRQTNISRVNLSMVKDSN